MAATTNSLGLAPGEVGLAANATAYAGSLGHVYIVNGNGWKVVKSGAAIAAATIQSRVMLDAGTTAKTNIVSAAAGAAAVKHLIAGIGHPSQVAIASGDYFLIQVSGRATAIAVAAGVTTATPQITGAAGTTGDAGVISTAVWSQLIGVAHATAANGVAYELEMEAIA